MLTYFLPGLAQVADFSSDLQSGCSPLLVRFSDQSTGTVTSWSWDFGNGNTSNLQNPSAIYSSPGTYTVALTVNGSTTTTKTNYITVYSDPQVDFTSNHQNGCTPFEVSFQDNSLPGSGTIKSWEWIFGDGGTSMDKNPVHVYNSAGMYSVTLTVTNEFDCESTLTKTNFISVDAFHAEFKVDETDFCEFPAEVDFTNLSVGPDSLSYSWNFGDGSSSKELNPKHTYVNSGIYTARLEVTSTACANADVYEVVINVGSKPAPVFTITPEVGCVGEPIGFTTPDDPNVAKWQWSFGDMGSSRVQNTSHIYALAGSYDVQLESTFLDNCAATSTKQLTILNAPSPDFKIKQDCDKGVTFENISSFSDSYLWDFGDGTTSTEESPSHEYSAFGSYAVTLEATNDGCSRLYERFVNVGNPIIADFSPIVTSGCDVEETLGGCLPKTIDFEDKSFSQNGIVSWDWDFGDGATSSLEDPTYTYTTPGDFTVVLTVTDLSGCTSSKERVVHVVHPDDRPNGSFDIDKNEVCVFELVTLTNTSTGNVDLWCWDVGDGRSFQSRVPSLTFNYNDVGVYSISLSVSYKGCPAESTFVRTDVITVLDPAPSFFTSKSCENPYTISITNETQNGDVYLWDFGDGKTSNLANPVTHTYDKTGNYLLSLTATNNTTGCKVKTFGAVNIYDVRADFEVSNNKVCLNEGISFTNLSSDAVEWHWEFGDSETSSLENPANITYSEPGTYTVSLTAFDPDGCSHVFEKKDLIVVADIRGDFRKGLVTNYCDSLMVEFEDLSLASPDIEEWTWDFGDGLSSYEQNPVHIFTDFGAYAVSLNLKNAEGECTVLRENAVVYTEPKPDFDLTKSAYCVQDDIFVFNKSLNAQRYTWFVNNDTLSGFNPTVSFSAKGSYDITLVAFDRDECSNRMTKKVDIQKPTATFEAQQISAECPPLNSTFLPASSEQVVKWDWRINGEFFSSFENPAHTFTIPGHYDVSLTVTDDLGCIDSSKVDELVKLGGPYGVYSISDNEGCLTEEVEFEVTATNTVKYTWDFGNGIVQETDGSRITHSYNSIGVFNPSIILEDEFGCQVALPQDFQINIFDTTRVSFSIPATFPFTGESIEVIYSDFPKGNWIWRMGDGTIIENERPIHSYAEGGNFNVDLAFINENGCESQFSQSIFIQEDLKFVPNVCTPNGDGANDTFDMLDLENGFWDVKIYDRNGKLVYSMDKYDGSWAARGVSAGIYYYAVTNQFRKDKTYKGYVRVFK